MAKKKTILDFFGKWPGSKEELDRMLVDIKKDRMTFKTRDFTF